MGKSLAASTDEMGRELIRMLLFCASYCFPIHYGAEHHACHVRARNVRLALAEETGRAAGEIRRRSCLSGGPQPHCGSNKPGARPLRVSPALGATRTLGLSVSETNLPFFSSIFYVWAGHRNFRLIILKNVENSVPLSSLLIFCQLR